MLDLSISKITGGEESLLQLCASLPKNCLATEEQTNLERASFQNNVVQSYKEQAVKRRQKRMVPPDRKDEAYWLRRFKNNEAAKISRKKRRLSDMALRLQLQALINENAILKSDLYSMKNRFEYSHRLYSSLLEQRFQNERDKELLKSIISFSRHGDESRRSDNLFPSSHRVDPYIGTSLPRDISTRNDKAFHTILMTDVPTVPVTQCPPPSVEPLIANLLGREMQPVHESNYKWLTPIEPAGGFSLWCQYSDVPFTPKVSQQGIVSSSREFNRLPEPLKSEHVKERSDLKDTNYFESTKETFGKAFRFNYEVKPRNTGVRCPKQPNVKDRKPCNPPKMDAHSAARRYDIHKDKNEISQEDNRGIEDVYNGVEWKSGMYGLPFKLRAKKPRLTCTASSTCEPGEKSWNEFDPGHGEKTRSCDGTCQPIDLSLPSLQND